MYVYIYIYTYIYIYINNGVFGEIVGVIKVCRGDLGRSNIGVFIIALRGHTHECVISHI